MALNPTPPDLLTDRAGRPYFAWDLDLTLEEFRARLVDPDPEVRAYFLAKAMRQEDFQVTATLDFAQRRSRNPRLVNIEPGDTTGRHFALAVDIGTTTV